MITVLGSLTSYNLRSGLEREPRTLRTISDECGEPDQEEDRGWVHRNGGWERVSVCRIDDMAETVLYELFLSFCIIVCQALNIVISVMQLLVAQIQTKIGCDNNKFPVCYK